MEKGPVYSWSDWILIPSRQKKVKKPSFFLDILHFTYFEKNENNTFNMVPKDAELDPAGKKIKDSTGYWFPLSATMKTQLIARVKTDSCLQVFTKSRCFSLSPNVMVASNLDLGYRKENSLRQGVGFGRPPTNEVMPEQK